MKAALDRIPTWVLAVVLVGLMGLLWYGLATRPGTQTATSPEPSPTSALDAPATAGEADGGRTVGEATEPGESPADDQSSRGTTPDEGQADDAAEADEGEDGDNGDTDAAADRSNSSDADDREATSAAVGNVGAGTVGTDGSVPGDSLVSSGDVAVVPTPAPDDRNDADADAFEADQDAQQDDLDAALGEAEPTIEQPGMGDLEADARALADARRDLYFEQQLEELEP